MNSKTIAPNPILEGIRSIYNSVVSFFDFDPTETIREQIREHNPNLEEQEIDRLTEEEVKRFFNEYYSYMFFPPM